MKLFQWIEISKFKKKKKKGQKLDELNDFFLRIYQYVYVNEIL